MTEVYEVYVCEYKGEIVYIGQGAKGRHKHCNNGASHVKELNRIHFMEGCDKLSISVLYEVKTKKKALDLEIGLIDKYRPKYNKVYNSSVNKLDTFSNLKVVKNEFMDYIVGVKLPEGSSNKYQDLVEEFLGYISARDLKEDTVLLYSSSHYINLGLNNLARLSRFIRNMDNQDSPNSSNTLLFYKAVKDIYDIDLKYCLHNRTKTSIL